MSREKPTLPLHYALRLPRVRINRPPMLVALHGMGSNDRDFIKQLEHFDDRFIIIAPRAAFPQTAGNSA